MNIRWGKMVNHVSDVVKAASEGFDYVEMSVDYVMGLSEEEFIKYRELLFKNKISAEIFNSILPIDVVVTKQGFNVYAWIEYLKKAAPRLVTLGGKKLVWNNGRARALPLEGDVGEAKEQAVQFIHAVGDLLESFGIEFLIEPLSLSKTNYLNSMEEVSELLRLVNKKNLSSVITLEELEAIQFEFDDALKYGELIKHIYLTDSTKLFFSKLEELEEIAYRETISLPSDADKALLQHCQSLYKES